MLILLQQNLGFAWGSVALVTVPNVVGETQAQGTADIQALGLSVGITSAYDPVIPIGIIISQNPIGGTQVGPGSNVDIVVSLGPQPQVGQVAGGIGPLYPSGFPMAKGIGYDKPKRKEEIIEEFEEILPSPPISKSKRETLTLKRPKVDSESLKALQQQIEALDSLTQSAQDAAKLKQLQEEEAIILLLLS